MIITVNENNHRLTTLLDFYCNIHRAPWHWFFGWRNYDKGINTYRIPKRVWKSIINTCINLLDIEAEKSVDC